MLKLGKQILHTLVLLITGMALIGVNVTQSGCIHSDRTYLEVRVLPAENTCPCEEECGCCQEERQFCKDCCHASSRHDFYKVAGFSQLVKSALPDIVFFYPNVGVFDCLTQVPDIEERYFLCPEIIPDLPPSPELLCTYRC